MQYKFNTSNEVERFKIHDRYEIKKGTWLKLQNSLGDDYKMTKFYDASLVNPSWQLFYASSDDFRFLNHCYMVDNGSGWYDFGKVRRLFGDELIELTSVCLEGDTYIGYATGLRIDLLNALETNEISIINDDQNLEISKAFEYLNEAFESYVIGLTEVRLEDVIGQYLFRNMWILSKHWYLYDRNMNGVWIRK